MRFSFIKRLFTGTEEIETDILEYIASPYIVFSDDGACVRRHAKITEVFLDLDLGETDMCSLDALINSLQKIKMNDSDPIVQNIFDEHVALSSDNYFIGVVRYEETYVLAQVHSLAIGSYAVFKNVTAEYFYLHSYKESDSNLCKDLNYKLLGQVACDVAHDFNNILSVIEGYMRLIQKDHKKSDLLQERLSHISAAVKQGAFLSHQILNYGQSDEQDTEVFDLSDYVSGIESLFKPLMPSNIDLKVAVSGPAYIYAKTDFITQILMNLVLNARDAIADKKGDITISLVTEAASAILSVTDNGYGIGKNTKEKIFERNFTTKKEKGGFGLGLWLVKDIVSQIDGDIKVESTKGIGTYFSIVIPLAEAEQRPSERAIDNQKTLDFMAGNIT